MERNPSVPNGVTRRALILGIPKGFYKAEKTLGKKDFLKKWSANNGSFAK